MKPIKILLLLISLCYSLHAGAKDFTFTAIPDQDTTQLAQRFGSVAAYLEAQLGIKVVYIPVKSYAAAVSAFTNNEVQLAWFGGLSGVQARMRVPGSEAIAQGYEDQFFKTYFIANTGTGLTQSENFPTEIEGKTLTFGSKGSTSGRLMPEFYIRKAFNKTPGEIFNRVGFSGDHSRTIALVSTGAYQVGVLNYKVWERELAEGKIDLTKVNVIWETPKYPDYQWSIRGDVDKVWGKGFSAKVKHALINMNNPELLANFPREGFVEAKNSDYQPILDTAKGIGLID
jgi:phosphonate transport system substrate-binding protein